MHYLLNTLQTAKNPSEPVKVSGKIDREQIKIPYRYLEKMRTEGMFANEKVKKNKNVRGEVVKQEKERMDIGATIAPMELQTIAKVSFFC